MAVESTLTKIIYPGNGSATEFPVPFAYSRTDDLRLILTGTDGTETPEELLRRIFDADAGATAAAGAAEHSAHDAAQSAGGAVRAGR